LLACADINGHCNGYGASHGSGSGSTSGSTSGGSGGGGGQKRATWAVLLRLAASAMAVSLTRAATSWAAAT